MSDLDALVKNVESAISRDNGVLPNIKHPHLFLSSLKELQGLIGNKRIKNSIAGQINRLLQDMEDPDGKGTRPMLSTVLYGGPGIGKTTIGKKMAKIWYAMGFLERGTKPKTMVDNIKDACNKMGMEGMMTLAIWIMLIYAILGGAMKALYSKVGMAYFALGLAMIIGLMVLVYYFAYKSKEVAMEETAAEGKKVRDEDIITIVSKEDFVAKYLGQTEHKTKALLLDNLGKVIFIDEAYSLISGSNDVYGKDALNTINRFMSEHPSDCIIIFAGYESKMKSGIFSVQPGLVRRCMWHFSCDNYEPEELYDIFEYQLDESGWRVENPDEARQLIADNYDAFPSMGGDTERLCNYAKTAHTSCNMKGRGRRDKILTTANVKAGIKELWRNNIEHSETGDDDDEDGDQWRKILNQYSGNHSKSKRPSERRHRKSKSRVKPSKRHDNVSDTNSDSDAKSDTEDIINKIKTRSQKVANRASAATVSTPVGSDTTVLDTSISVSTPVIPEVSISTPTVSDTTVSTPLVSNITVSTPVVSDTTVSTPLVSDTTVSTPLTSDTTVSSPHTSDTTVSSPSVLDTAISTPLPESPVETEIYPDVTSAPIYNTTSPVTPVGLNNTLSDFQGMSDGVLPSVSVTNTHEPFTFREVTEDVTEEVPSSMNTSPGDVKTEIPIPLPNNTVVPSKYNPPSKSRTTRVIMQFGDLRLRNILTENNMLI